MATRHEVLLRIGAEGTVVRSWDEVTITRDMLSAGSPWTVTLWRQGRSDSWDRIRDVARGLAPVSVEIDGAPQLRGTIERVRDGASRAGAPFTLSGRDAIAAAIVSDVDPTLSLRGATLEEVAERALAPLGLGVVIGADADEARAIQAGARPGARTTRRTRRGHHVDRFKPKPGEKVWPFLEALCRRHGFLVWPVPYGSGAGLVIDRPAYDSPATQSLVRRRVRANDNGASWEGNLLSGFRDLDVTEVPSAVTVFGHASLTAREDARHRGTVLNDRLAHARVAAAYTPRPRYIRDPRARSPQIAEQRARLELAHANASLESYEATVQGFSNAGRLWTVNTMVNLDDELTSATGAWLVTRVTFARSRASGHTTTLRLVPRGALVVEPDPEV